MADNMADLSYSSSASSYTRRRNRFRDSWPIGNIRPLSTEHYDSRHATNLHVDAQNRSEWLAQREPPPEDEYAKKSPSFLLILALFVSVFLAAVDTTILTTALPTITQYMGTDQAGFTWIGSGYLLAGAASEPIWAKLSDIWGRRPMILVANVVFLTGSIVCASSTSIGVLILGRVIQGIGSGGMMVLTNIVIGDLFSPRFARRCRTISTVC